VYDGVEIEPTDRSMEEAAEYARTKDVDGLIAVGGGSAIDTCKAVNLLTCYPAPLLDYVNKPVGKGVPVPGPLRPLIAVPTTAGTGSECQSFALIADEETHQKMACGDPKAAARIALLDPALTLTQPRGVTACTGVDAIAHAVETAVTRRRNPFSLLYSREAFRLTIHHLPRVLDNPDDLEARAWMLLGAAYAGTAIENSMLGAAHSTANPLTARHNVIHGQAVGMMLPYIVRFNAVLPSVREMYRELAVYAGLVAAEVATEAAVDALVERLRSALASAGFPASLAECGIREEEIPVLAAEAAQQWTATFNPRDITADDFAALYKEALRAV
jgi:alcohol dehydrogenase